MPRKYKEVPKCPPELERIFNKVNSLPANAGEITKELNNLANKANNLDYEDSEGISSLRLRFVNLISDIELFKPLVKKILSSPHSSLLMKLATRKIADIEQSQRVLRYIAQTNRNPEAAGIDLLNMYHRLAGGAGEPFFRVTFNYKDGKFRTYGARLLPILRKTGISFSRIAECPNCKCIYWARKANSGTCGEKKCADALGNQKRRLKAKKEAENFN